MSSYLQLSSQKQDHEDNFEDDLKFRCNSFEKIDFILYRYTLGTFLLFHLHVVFIELSKTKPIVQSGSVRKYSQGECREV